MSPHDPDAPLDPNSDELELPLGEMQSGMPGEEPRPLLPATPVPEDEEDDAIDFGDLPPAEGGSAALSRSQLIGPLSGASIVSWNELIKARQAEEARQAEIRRQAKPIDVDAESDQDLLHRFLSEEQSRNPTPDIEEESVDLFSRPDDPSNPLPAELSGRYRFPRSDIPSPSDIYERTGGPELFDAGGPTDVLGSPSQGPIPSVDMTELLSAVPRDKRPPSDPTGPISDSSILGRKKQDSDIDLLESLSSGTGSGNQLAKTDELDVPFAGVPSDDEIADIGIFGEVTAENSAVDLGSQGGVIDLPFPLPPDSSVATTVARPTPRRPYEDSGTVDLVNVSHDEPPLLATSSSPRKQARVSPPPSSGGGSARTPAGGSVVSGLIGAASGVAVCAGLWLSGAVPSASALLGGKTQAASLNEQIAAVNKALDVGDLAGAKKLLETMPDIPPLMVVRAQTAWWEYLKQCRTQRQSPKHDSPEAEKVRGELKLAAADPMAMLWLGLIEESCGRLKVAEQIYRDAEGRFQDRKELFQAALNRLGSRPPAEAKRPPADPQLGLALFTLLLQAGPPAADADIALPEEAGFKFWEALKLAADHDYPAAKTALKQARDAHDLRRFVLARRGLNPLSDPFEDIFLRSCDELTAYFNAREKLHTGGYNLVANKTATRAVDKILTDVRQARDDAKAARASMTVVRDQVQRAGLDVNDLPTSVRTMAQNSIALAAARQEARAARGRVTELEAELGGARKELESARKMAAPSEPTDPKLTDRVAALQAELSAARADKSRLEAQVKELEGRLVSRPAAGDPALATKLRSLEQDLAKVNQQKATLEARIQEFESRPRDDQGLTRRLNELQTQVVQLNQTKGELETKLKELEARPGPEALARAERERAEAIRRREELEQRQQDLQARVTEAAQQLTQFRRFMAGVTERLQTAEGAKPEDVLRTLEQALAAKPAVSTDGPPPPLPPVPPALSRSADREYSTGLEAFQQGQYGEAERRFRRAVELNPRDARYRYHLGLALQNLGRTGEAVAAFRTGQELERQGMPGPSMIDGMLDRIQGPARAALDRGRG